GGTGQDVLNDPCLELGYLKGNSDPTHLGTVVHLPLPSSRPFFGGLGLFSTDVDGDGVPNVIVFDGVEWKALVLDASGQGRWINIGLATNLGPNTLASSMTPLDANGDGLTDILINPHAESEPLLGQLASVTYAGHIPTLWLNVGDGHFRAADGPDFEPGV